MGFPDLGFSDRLRSSLLAVWDPTPRLSEQEMVLATASRPPNELDPWSPAPVATSAPVIPLAEQVRDQTEDQILLAPPSVADRHPIQIGQNLTGTYLSSAYRLCTQGWRYQFVDLINELLEFDPHARGVTRQRVLGVAGDRIEVHPARLPKNDPDTELSIEIAEHFEQQLHNIPSLKQALSHLNWGVIYGVSGCEILWDKAEKNWDIEGLVHIHSRRLNYPNPMSWDLSIYDQGMVGPGYTFGPTNSIYGLPVANYPGKFIIHTPALNGDYPTRDGEGRYIGLYMLLKRMIVRASALDFERLIHPWVVGYFNRKLQEGQEQSIANKEDIAVLQSALRALGAGTMNSAALPDSVRIELLRAVTSFSATDFVSFLNREMSKALLGQAFTTEPGANGNLSTSQMAQECTMDIVRYDAGCLCDTLKRDLATPWMRLNYPEAKRRLLPRITILVDEEPEPSKTTEMAKLMTDMDAPVDIDKLSEINGIPLVAKDDTEARRSRAVSPGKGPTPTNAAEQVAEENLEEGGATTIDQSTIQGGVNTAPPAAEPSKQKRQTPNQPIGKAQGAPPANKKK